MCVSGCHHRHRQASDNSSAVSGYIYFNRFHQQMINPSMALGWQRPGLQAEQLNTTTGLSMRESRKKMRVGMNEHRLLRLSGVTETAVQTVHEVGLTKETRVREREKKRQRNWVHTQPGATTSWKHFSCLTSLLCDLWRWAQWPTLPFMLLLQQRRQGL